MLSQAANYHIAATAALQWAYQQRVVVVGRLAAEQPLDMLCFSTDRHMLHIEVSPSDTRLARCCREPQIMTTASRTADYDCYDCIARVYKSQTHGMIKERLHVHH